MADPLHGAIDRLVSHFGPAHRERLAGGVRRVAERWKESDGDFGALETFCRENFVADPAARAGLVGRLETAVESIHGHLYELRRTLRWWSDTDTPSLKPLDDQLATFDPAPDLSEQLYRQRIAFVALLNLERPDLATMLRDGPGWTREQWVEARIARFFGPRIPAELAELARRTTHAAEQFVARFHVPVGTLVDERGQRVMPDPKRALIVHWLVRDEITARYGEPDGHLAQRALSWAMHRHIDGSMPSAIMDGSAVEAGLAWDAKANTIGGRPVTETVGLKRYEHLLAQRAVAVKYDALHPEHPTAMARKFELAREIPQTEVVALIEALLDAPVRVELARFLERRLGRKLEPFDIYLDSIGEERPASDLRSAVRRRFGDEKAFQALLPAILEELGFPRSEASFLGERIVVEIARGSGHAMRPALPEFKAWLRTSRLADELGWDGFDTAMHELGHTVEQVISCHFAPSPVLRGVPNTACTEAFAFLYQSLGRRVLGLVDESQEARNFAVDSVQTMLTACQIAGPSLFELRLWSWIYDHPEADPASLREAALSIADELWERFFRRDFGPDPYRLLAAYQHMINHPLYLADYTLGHVISHQVRSHMRGRDLASETRRICSIGRVTPDLWMRRAVGGPISIESLVKDAAEGLRTLGG